MSRLAIYFAPEPDSLWWQAGSAWLGRDAWTGRLMPPPSFPYLDSALLSAMTATPRRYGFHATLAPPWYLKQEITRNDFLRRAQDFASTQQHIALPQPKIVRLRGFLALAFDASAPDAQSLAQRTLEYFQPVRMPMTREELESRGESLPERHRDLLTRWGYAYAEDQFRLHFTLSDRLSKIDTESAARLEEWAQTWFAGPLRRTPLVLDALTIFEESEPGGFFTAIARFPFSKA